MKKLDIDALIGATLMSATLRGEKRLLLTCADGRRYEVQVDDDGCGGNDSHAYFDGVTLDSVLGRKISAARHEDMSSEGVRLVIEADDAKGVINITHDHNGYYGFSYEVVPVETS